MNITIKALLSWMIEATRGGMMPATLSPIPIKFTAIAKIRFCLITVMVELPILRSFGIRLRSSVARTIPAVSMATSVPLRPIAIPTSLVARAGRARDPQYRKKGLLYDSGCKFSLNL